MDSYKQITRKVYEKFPNSQTYVELGKNESCLDGWFTLPELKYIVELLEKQRDTLEYERRLDILSKIDDDKLLHCNGCYKSYAYIKDNGDTEYFDWNCDCARYR